MRVLLVLPPQFFPECPYLSVALLAGYLREHSRHEVVQRDTNLEFARFLLDPSRIAMARRRLEKRVAQLETAGGLRSLRQRIQYVRCTRLLCQTTHLAGEAGEVEEWLRSPWRPDGFLEKHRAHTLFALARDLLAAEFYPGMDTPEAMDWSSVSRRLEDSRTNPYIEFFETRLLPGVAAGDIHMVGISVPFESQLVPALTLARLLRRSTGVFVVLGGPYITHIRERIAGLPDLLRLAHAWVLYEGEEPLLRLADALESGSPLEEVPNLLYGDSRSGGVITPVLPPARFRPTAVPDYDGVLERGYFAQRTAAVPNIQLRFSSGCYWGKCTFCTHPQTSSTYQLMARGEETFQQIRHLAQRHDVTRFVFQDSAIPLGPLRAMARRIVESRLRIQWAGTLHLERSMDRPFCELLAQSGCRILSSGLETGSQRILDLMDKGYRVSEFLRIVDDLIRSGIAVRLSMIFGFPGEKDADREQTIELITGLFRRYNTDRIMFWCDFNEFELEESAPVGRNPERYGITFRRRDDAEVHLGRECVKITSIDSQACRTAIRRVLNAFREHILCAPALLENLARGDFENIFFDDSPTDFARLVLQVLRETYLGRAQTSRSFGPDDVLEVVPKTALLKPKFDISRGAADVGGGEPLTLAVPGDQPGRILPLLPELERLLSLIDGHRTVREVVAASADRWDAAGAAALSHLRFLCRNGFVRPMKPLALESVEASPHP